VTNEIRVAIVTGGAAGIGESCVNAFVARDYLVMIADLDDARGESLAQRIVAAGGQARYLHCDVGNRDDIVNVVNRAVHDYGRLDVMVNNAGIAPAGDTLLDLTDDLFEQIIRVNLRGVFLGLQIAGRAMIDQGFGNIVSMASIGALPGVLGGFAYDSSKAGVVKMTILAAAELAAHNVRVNAVCPGMHLTPLAEQRTPGATRRDKEELFAGMQPIGRCGRPEDVANAVVWLAGDDASFITGQSIVIDGGLVVAGWGATMSERFRSAAG
jgi:NAD(P)-dependent dehydrogenase (short-subunit alcohol dehydrogenase family)